MLPTIALLAAIAIAFAASARATLIVPRAQRTTWLVFAAVALLMLVARGVYAAGQSPNDITVARAILVLAFVTWTAGTAIGLQSVDKSRYLEVTVDSALVVVAAAVAVLQWAPGPYALPVGIDLVSKVRVIVGPVGTLAALAFTLVPLVDGAGRKDRSTIALAVAALLFAIATLPLAIQGADCCRQTVPVFASELAAWGFLAYAAVMAPIGRAVTTATPPNAFRVRQVIAPAVAVIMAAALIDSAARPPLQRATGVALAALGCLLAFRLTLLLEATKRQTEERRELAQKRALVEVSNALAGATDLHATLELVTHWACRLLNAQAAVIELLTEDGKRLALQAAVGMPAQVIGLVSPVEGSFTGWVVQKRAPRTTSDVTDDRIHNTTGPAMLGRSPTAAAPLRSRDDVLGVLSCIGHRSFSSDDLELLQALADQAAVAIENARLFEQVHALSLTDPLTGLANRRQLERDLAREFAAARRGRQLVAVMFDLDGFKDYNDQHGHLAGDEVLRAFGEALTTETRAMNLAVRYGGDEFLVLLADSDRAGADIFIDRVRDRFRYAVEDLGRSLVGVTAGVAEYHAEMREPIELVAAADRALYAIKAARSST